MYFASRMDSNRSNGMIIWLSQLKTIANIRDRGEDLATLERTGANLGIVSKNTGSGVAPLERILPTDAVREMSICSSFTSTMV